MPVQTPIPEARLAELEDYQRNKCNALELKRFLCVWLRVESGLQAKAIATALRMNANTVRIIQRKFIANGVVAFEGSKRGPKNPFLMSFEEEKAFLESFLNQACSASMLTVGEIKVAWEKKLGKKAHRATLYRMLKRHSWRKVIPRPKHPKQNKEAVEAFKKGATEIK